MGIYQINCSRGGETVEWHSGCYMKTRFPVHDEMAQAGAINVLEENEPKCIEAEHQKLNGELRAELEKQVRLRVQTERERDNLAFDNQLYKQKVDELREELDALKHDIERQLMFSTETLHELDAAKAEIERRCVNIDKLESDLRMTNAILDVHMRHSERKRQRIAKLEHLLQQLYAVNGLHVPEDL